MVSYNNIASNYLLLWSGRFLDVKHTVDRTRAERHDTGAVGCSAAMIQWQTLPSPFGVEGRKSCALANWGGMTPKAGELWRYRRPDNDIARQTLVCKTCVGARGAHDCRPCP
jgi:hypothetical protein